MAVSPGAKRHVRGLRWWIIALVAVCVVINYLDRSTLAVAIPSLKQLFDISTEQYSYAVAAFQGAYMVMQPLAGYILDALGTRIGFAVFAVGWSIAAMLHGLMTGWISLSFYRGLLGMSEAGVIPASVKVVAEWFPDREKTVATGWFTSGTSIGAMIAPPFVVWCLLHHDWQLIFIASGALGFIWVAIWLFVYADPANHPRLTPDEHAYIVEGQAGASEATAAGSTVDKASKAALLRSRSLWSLMACRFLIAPAWGTFNFWIPIYLATVRHMDLKELAMFAWMPFLAADLGSIAGGYMAPLFMRWGASLMNSRKLVVTVGALLMFGPASIGLATSRYTAVLLFCIGGFAHQAISGTLITMASDLFPKQTVATASGWTGMAAFLGSMLFSLLIGAVAGTIGYNPLFVCLALFDVTAAIVLWTTIRTPPPDAAPGAA